MDKIAGPNIFEFTDYRKFLINHFEWRRATAPRFSLRNFSDSVSSGLSGSSFLSGVLKGSKNIGPTLRGKFAKALRLKAKEEKYFDYLVQFNQATDLGERSRLFAQLAAFSHSKAKLIFENQFRFFTKWYYPVIWNYFGLRQDVRLASEIAARIHPKVSVAEVNEAIKLLLDLGMIKRLANGYAVTENHFTTEPEFRGLEAVPYCEMFLQLAMKALHSVPRQNRKFGTLVFTASEDTLGLIREKMTGFHEEVQALIAKDDRPDGIHTLSYQLFPNTPWKETLSND